MPFYDYECSSCGARSTLQHDYDEEEPFCPFCEKRTLKRVYSSSFTVKKENKSGQITKKAIEDAREEVKQQKEIARKDI